MWSLVARLVADQVLEAAVVYGYFPCFSEGNALVVQDENGAKIAACLNSAGAFEALMSASHRLPVQYESSSSTRTYRAFGKTCLPDLVTMPAT